MVRLWVQKIPFPILNSDGYSVLCVLPSTLSVVGGMLKRPRDRGSDDAVGVEGTFTGFLFAMHGPSFCLGLGKGSLLLQNNNCTVFVLDLPICQITHPELSKLKNLQSLLLEPRRGSTGSEAVEEAAESIRELMDSGFRKKIKLL